MNEEQIRFDQGKQHFIEYRRYLRTLHGLTEQIVREEAQRVANELDITEQYSGQRRSFIAGFLAQYQDEIAD